SIHELRHLVWFSRGDWRDAATSLEREVAFQPDPHYRLHLHGIMIVWLARCGGATRSADIDRYVLAARTDAVAAGCRRCAREMALRLAEAFARLGRASDAQKELGAWGADGRAAELTDQVMSRHVRGLGVRTWRRPQVSRGEGGLDQLSPRERQIAKLVAAGNSNPEIANALFLSRKTVERHVSNVLARTGARNRTDLARLVSNLTP